ncbi:MAG: RNA methyltransferase [Candidatus Uhrbacteria bacterium]|nr:RNA methyltransferase [Candidatus Uhrbacteria bacterium]
MTPRRKKRIESVLAKRQQDLMVIIENVDDPHNVGAILRSCDAFGVGEVHLLYPPDKGEKGGFRGPRLSELRSKAAASALKWLRVTKWDSTEKLVRTLKHKNIKIAVTTLTGRAKDPINVDLTQPIAIVIGNEHDGVSKEMMKAADYYLKIPMRGFVESFNVSVAAALLLYEASRQRDRRS